MKSRVQFLFVLGSIVLAGCSNLAISTPVTPTQPAPQIAPTATQETLLKPGQSPEPIHIVDALGREVNLQSPPQRIVVTGKALIMILDAVYTFPEAPNRIAAIGNAAQGSSNFIAMIDQNYQAKATLQLDSGAEQIAAVHPDLVILKSALSETLGKPLETLGIPVVFVDFETPEQYIRDLQILGEVFQDKARAQALVNYYQERVEQIQTKLVNTSEKPRTLLLYYNESGGSASFNVPPLSWMQTQLVELAGGEPVWGNANPGQGWTKVALEQIAAWDADQIFIVSYTKNPSDVVATLKEDPQWQAMRAVKQNHLYAFAGDIYSWDQPDVRWILGLSWLATRLHPELFSGADVTRQAQEFYQQLYGLDPTFFDQKILPQFKGGLP